MIFSKKILTLFVLTLIINACSLTAPKPANSQKKKVTKSKELKPKKVVKELSLEETLLEVEKKATLQGRKVLKTARKMTLDDEEIIKGGCWDYANEVYNRAGFPNRGKKRQTIFKGSQKKGPYAKINLIKAGDFLYYINHSYGDIEHSAIFIKWLDYKEKIALMLSYAGERRAVPARYTSYELSNVYRIIRGK